MAHQKRSARAKSPQARRKTKRGKKPIRSAVGRLARMTGKLVLLAALVCGIAFALYTWIGSHRKAGTPVREKTHARLQRAGKPKPSPAAIKPDRAIRSKSATPKKAPTFEVFPGAEIPLEQPKPQAETPPRRDLPRVAIIIDDIGYDQSIAEKFMELNIPLTLSILPHSPFGKRISEMARKHGTEIMLHLPMEPNEYPQVDPGKDALLVTMSKEEIADRVSLLLNAFPAARGVNNHMGSRFTTQTAQMGELFEVLRRRGLFFIDSRTTAQTVARQVAQRMGLLFAERDVFLDDEQNSELIRRQLEKLVETAQLKGEAIGVAHPHDETYRVLLHLSQIPRKQIRLVPASQLVHHAAEPG
jgi:polysaccharide deacetylase 2 family uncharacterized protein YibQ